MIQLINVSKVYATVPPLVALRNVSLDVAPGEFVILVGPSGSGKSTLLNIASTLDQPTSGHIELFGENFSGKTESQLSELRARKIAYIFQAHNLLPALTAVENVEYVLFNQGCIHSLEARELALEALGKVGMTSWASHLPRELSGGQQQRVAVARALVGKPEILFGDEPTASLDTKNANELFTLLRSLSKEHGITLLISTHDTKLHAYADRLIRLTDGSLSYDA